MRIGITALVVAALASAAAPPVDPALVGTWEMVVPNSDGLALWVWDVHADGTYLFHAEGPGNVPSHSGTFQAAQGKYSLKSTTMDWVDQGTYDPPARNVLRATGRLGTGSWTRVTAADLGRGVHSAPPSIPVTRDISTVGFGADGNFNNFDAATSAGIRTKNQGRIQVHGIEDALVDGSMNKRPVILFFSGGTNIDALVYNDAMLPLAQQTTIGLITEGKPDFDMKNRPASNPATDDTYPRVLVVRPLFTGLDFFIALNRKRTGQDSAPLFEFVWEHNGALSAQQYAAQIGAQLKKLAH